MHKRGAVLIRISTDDSEAPVQLSQKYGASMRTASKLLARAHELRIAEMQLLALAPPPPKDLKLQLIELKELLDEDFITQEEYSLKRQSLLASF